PNAGSSKSARGLLGFFRSVWSHFATVQKRIRKESQASLASRTDRTSATSSSTELSISRGTSKHVINDSGREQVKRARTSSTLIDQRGKWSSSTTRGIEQDVRQGSSLEPSLQQAEKFTTTRHVAAWSIFGNASAIGHSSEEETGELVLQHRDRNRRPDSRPTLNKYETSIPGSKITTVPIVIVAVPVPLFADLRYSRLGRAVAVTQLAAPVRAQLDRARPHLTAKPSVTVYVPHHPASVELKQVREKASQSRVVKPPQQLVALLTIQQRARERAVLPTKVPSRGRKHSSASERPPTLGPTATTPHENENQAVRLLRVGLCRASRPLTRAAA
ncbi:unnamed protein product, partial [Amoebophrya sp. A120]